jgi:hypothetical protein
MGVNYNTSIVTDGLVLCLDAANKRSYPGSGTTWFDLSGNGNNFTINSSAYSTSGGVAHMNFEGSFGSAKRLVNGSMLNVPNFSNATIIIWSTILNSTATWRTLIRGSSADHQVIIQNGGNIMGMFDNDTGGQFQSSGFDITSLPNPYTQFNFMCWRLSQSSPYYQFQFNNNSTVYPITTASSTFNNGFSVIGAFHSSSNNINTSSQYWGKIANFSYYNRFLTPQEIRQNFNATKSRYGI